eukprot:5912319-Amphidinium_carterae.1
MHTSQELSKDEFVICCTCLKLLKPSASSEQFLLAMDILRLYQRLDVAKVYPEVFTAVKSECDKTLQQAMWKYPNHHGR